MTTTTMTTPTSEGNISSSLGSLDAIPLPLPLRVDAALAALIASNAQSTTSASANAKPAIDVARSGRVALGARGAGSAAAAGGGAVSAPNPLALA